MWILAKLPEQFVVAGDDVADKYLLLSNSHDGGSSVLLKFTTVRVVCQNTLMMALRRGPSVRVPHFRSVRQRMRHAQDLLGIIKTQYADLEQHFQRMVKAQLNPSQLQRYLEKVFPDPADPRNHRAAARVASSRSWSRHFFEFGKGQTSAPVRGTLWAAYNGVAEFVDHCVPATKVSAPAARRPVAATPSLPRERKLASVWFGDGYYAKARALEVVRAWKGTD